MSARVGSNAMLVQGAGGNTSLKRGDQLLVKASGTWLADACTREIFIALPRFNSAGASAPHAEGLHPSIETALHALMPHRVVIHAHAVNSMTTSVLEDGQRRAAHALDDRVRWAWVGYHRPGAPLAEAVVHALGSAPDVLLLQNHGVVVGAETVAAAEQLLSDVERLLHLPERSLPAPDAVRLAEGASDQFEPLLHASGLAIDSEIAAIVSTTCFIPDQVVFLGGAIPLGREGDIAADVAAGALEATGTAPVLVLIPGRGAYGARERSSGAESLIRAVIEIARRLPPGAKVVGLTADQIRELVGWDAEVHRQKLDRERG